MAGLLAEVPSIFPIFAKNFQLLRIGEAPIDDESGGFFPPEESKDDSKPSDLPKDMCEPIVPANGGNSLVALLQAGGTVSEYAYQWWSLDFYPKGTTIKYHGMELIVDTSDDYSEDGGFWVHYLKGRDDHVPSTNL